MSTLQRAVFGAAILVMSTCFGLAADETAQGTNRVDQRQIGENPVTTEMRVRMKRRVPEDVASAFAMNLATFKFEEFADEFGLDKSRRSLVQLLQDSDPLIRDISATAAQNWLTPDNLDEATLQALLMDSSADVRLVALRFLPESGLSLEPVFRIARDEKSDLQYFAMELLPKLIMKGNNDAKDVLREMITSRDPQIAGRAIQLAGTLGVHGRFAESQLRERLDDERAFSIVYMSQFCLSGTQTAIKGMAAEALRETGFDDEATAKALRTMCDSSVKEFSAVENLLPFDQAPWSSAAITLAVCRHDYAPVREAIFLRSHGTYKFWWPDTELVRVLLDLAPDAITGWEHGERVCRRLLSTPTGRREGDNWIALTKYPNAATVFEPEMRELLQDEATDKEPPAEVCSIEQVITFLASDGFSKDDLDYSLLLIGKQHRSATAYAVYLADLELSKAIVANDLQRIAEMMMVSLLRDPSIDPSQFRELLEQLPAKERMKSYSRIRLEKILDGVATPEE